MEEVAGAPAIIANIPNGPPHGNHEEALVTDFFWTYSDSRVRWSGHLPCLLLFYFSTFPFIAGDIRRGADGRNEDRVCHVPDVPDGSPLLRPFGRPSLPCWRLNSGVRL